MDSWVLQKTEVMNCGHAKRMSYQPHMQTQQTKHLSYLYRQDPKVNKS